MRYFPLALAGWLLAGLAACTADDPPGKGQSKDAPKVTAAEIDRLIMQLGDDDTAKRRVARQQLVAIGGPAVEGLKKAAESSDDPEVRKAAKSLLDRIDAKDKGVLHVFNVAKARVNGVAFRADGKRAVSASWDGTIRYWDLEDHSLIRQISGHGSPVMGVAFFPDGKRIASGSSDHTLRVWDLDSGMETHATMMHPNTVWDVAVSPDGKTVLSGCSDGNARLWDLRTCKTLQTFDTHKGGRAWTVAFTPDGKRAVTGGGNTFEKTDGPAASLRLWDLATGKEIRQFEGHAKDVRRVAISPDGRRLLSASFDGTVRLWDVATGKALKKFDGPGNFVEAVSFTPDGKRAVCSYGPGSAEAVYDEDPRCSLKLWDLATGKELRQFTGHGGPVLCLAISADGEFLASGSADGTMRLWEMPK